MRDRSEYFKKYRIANKEKHAQYMKLYAPKYYKDNKEKIDSALYAWREKNKDKLRIIEKTYYLKNKEKRNNYTNEYSKNNRFKFRLKMYGITEEEFILILKKQKNKCPICGEEYRKGFHIDHCHKTSKVRGILCGRCNSVLGFSRDSMEILKRAIKYLKKNEKMS